MKVVFRADASLEIGTGHVMRCLALADELNRREHECWFVCREHSGHLGDLIVNKEHGLTLLPASEGNHELSGSRTSDDYAAWLGVPWQLDAEQTLQAITDLSPDWLVVDHYALDADWERHVAAAADKVMVIDDLADRPHQCDLLLDQTFGRILDDYNLWVPKTCKLLCGSEYALLRPEFAELRPFSLQRREQPVLRQLLITMGGVDKDDVTGQVLDALHESGLPGDCRIVVVMGATAPWLDAVKKKARTLPWPTEVKVGVSNMAQLMAESDLAIGAAGTTSWERCCLGLPTIMLMLAENQCLIAELLENSGAARSIEVSRLSGELVSMVDAADTNALICMSESSRQITDGQGVDRAVAAMGFLE